MQEKKENLHIYIEFCNFLLDKEYVFAGWTDQQAHSSKPGIVLTLGLLQEK